MDDARRQVADRSARARARRPARRDRDCSSPRAAPSTRTSPTTQQEVAAAARAEALAFLTVDHDGHGPARRRRPRRRHRRASRSSTSPSARSSRARRSGPRRPRPPRSSRSASAASTDDAGDVLIAANSTVTNTRTGSEGQVRYYRLRLSLVREGDRWLTSNLRVRPVTATQRRTASVLAVPGRRRRGRARLAGPRAGRRGTDGSPRAESSEASIASAEVKAAVRDAAAKAATTGLQLLVGHPRRRPRRGAGADDPRDAAALRPHDGRRRHQQPPRAHRRHGRGRRHGAGDGVDVVRPGAGVRQPEHVRRRPRGAHRSTSTACW